MHLPVFENAYLLQSIGWAIANSFWQIGILWLLYQCITSIDKKLAALVKHHLSIVLLITSFMWFICTIVQNYILLTKSISVPAPIDSGGWLLKLQPVNLVLPYLSIIYLLVLCFYATQFSINLSANRFLQSNGLRKAPVDFRLFINHTAIHLGIKKKVQVWVSEHVDVPSVTGFIKPVILLPAALISHLSIQQIEAILLHELAHIKRNDYLVNLFQSVIEMILFFNPFAILLSKAAKKERENCCDDWVINFKYDQYEYAHALLALEEERHLLQYRFAIAATNGKKNLLQRIKRLFLIHPRTSFSTSQKFKLFGLCLLLSAAIFTVPFVENRPVIEKSGVYNQKENLNLKNIGKQLKENFSKNVFTSRPVRSSTVKSPVPVKKNIKAIPKNNPDGDFVTAFINEELLNSSLAVEPFITQVADVDVIKSIYFIKVEEQQSGEKQTNTYYFELKNSNGNAAIKPLIMLNKYKAPLKKRRIETLLNNPDTLTRPGIKKRTTS